MMWILSEWVKGQDELYRNFSVDINENQGSERALRAPEVVLAASCCLNLGQESLLVLFNPCNFTSSEAI